MTVAPFQGDAVLSQPAYREPSRPQRSKPSTRFRSVCYIQAAPIEKLDVDEKWVTVPAEVGDVRVPIVKPVGAVHVQDALPAILYVHGGGWILGNACTHDRLVCELAVGVDAAVVFVEYDRSPEARYPVAIEQAYATARWIVQHGASEGLDASRLAVAGDSVGGDMAAALTILAKQRDFMMLNPLRATAATTGAVELAVHVLRKAHYPDGR